MGGKEGSKGYLYQALVAVLDAIEKDDWTEVYLEFETDNDKVDIAFKDLNENLEVIQVKSSKNNFNKSDIDKWLIELIEDKSDASKFKLILIGVGESKTVEYINSVKKIANNKSDKTSDKIKSTIPDLILSNINKVDIEMLNNDINSFEKNIGFTIYKFLDTNGCSVPSKVIDLIVGEITYKFNKLCTGGDFVSREDFIENILEWANYNYDLGKTDNLKKYFEVQYYHDNKFLGKLDIDLRLNVVKKDEEVEKIKLEIEDIYQDIKTIDIRYINNKKQMRALGLNRSVVQAINICSYNAIGSNVNVTISSESQDNIVEYLNNIGIKIYDGFFDLRNLKTRRTIYTERKEENLIGSDLAKKKYELLQKLDEYIGYINKYEDIREYLEYLSDYKILPLCIKNVSKRYLEHITLKLKIPKNLQVLRANNIEIPDEIVIEDIKEILEKLLCGREDSNIKEFNRKFTPYDYLSYMKSSEEKFVDFIDNMFEYKVFDNESDYTILQCNLKELNPHDAMYLPMNLMIKSNDGFEIEYSIKCKNMSKIQTGKIKA